MSVDLNVGDNFTTKVQANPTGTEFIIKSGTHRQQTVPLKTNDIYRFEAGAVMSGATAGAPETPVTSYAFNGATNGWPSGWKIIGASEASKGVIEYYKGDGNDGAIQGNPDNQTGARDGYAQDLIIRHMNDGAGGGSGIRMCESTSLSRVSCLRLEVYDCNFQGIRTLNKQYWKDCVIHDNGFGGLNNSCGTKTASTFLLIEGGAWYNNRLSVWLDASAGADGYLPSEQGFVRMVGVDLYDNPSDGAVFSEVSSNMQLHQCRVFNNGNGNPATGGMDTSAVFSRSARRTVMTESIIYGNYRSIGVVQSARTTHDGDPPCGLMRSVDHLYENNKIYVLPGADLKVCGVFQKNTGGCSVGVPNCPGETDPENQSGCFNVLAQPSMQSAWKNNEYFLPQGFTDRYAWGLANLTWDQWRALGQDQGSVRNFYSGSPPAMPANPFTGSGGGEEPPPPPPPPPGGGGGPLPAQVRVGAQIIVPVSARF